MPKNELGEETMGEPDEPGGYAPAIADFDAQIRCFSARFGLTAAETRVLGEIIGGDGLLAAAARLNIGEATARTHARRIFDKTGTKRQTELIRAFFETSVPGSHTAPHSPKYYRRLPPTSSVPMTPKRTA